MKNKLKLSSLQVKSFVTLLDEIEEQTLKGGSVFHCRETHGRTPICPTEITTSVNL